jgi:hypothetical protein
MKNQSVSIYIRIARGLVFLIASQARYNLTRASEVIAIAKPTFPSISEFLGASLIAQRILFLNINL